MLYLLESRICCIFSGLSVEFGTILVYTCEKSCWPQNHQTPMEEFCIIQEDPDELLFK
uniref:Programmed cell death protein 2 C-terminal domain-containing protein n=1 Tax=Spermophilus dauricus TaxID=99837 RepID=A0A8C9PBC6_SPEDA